MRRDGRIIATGAFAAVLALGGCGQSAESIIESATGADVQIGEESFSFESDSNGFKIEGGVGTGLPAGFPDDIPEPAGAVLLSTTETVDGLSVTWTWEGLAIEDFDRYVASLRAAGYDEEVTTSAMDLGEGNFTRGAILVGKGKTVSVSAFVAEGSSGLTIIITSASP